MIWKIILGIVLLFLVFSGICAAMAYNKMKRMNRWNEIKKGMREVDALDILGRDYNSMEVLPKYTKYTWTIKNSSYQGVRNIVLEVKDGQVLQIRHS